VKKEAVRPYILAIFILAFVLRVAYAVITPPYEAPDEYSHFSYVKYIHEMGELPVQPDPAVRAEELQFHQAPLYYMLVSPLFSTTTWIEGRPVLPLRFINILFAMLTLFIAYRFSMLVFPHSPFIGAMICAVLAFTPTFAYTSSTVRNGVLATLLASWGFYLCARKGMSASVTDRRWMWVGVISGLAILSNMTAIAFVAAAVIMVVATSRDWKGAIQRSAWFLTGIVSVSGWWFLRNKLLYGTWLKVVETGFESTHADMDFMPHVKYIVITVFKTFWAVFGRINEIYFTDLYRFYWWFAGLALLGFIRYLIMRNEEFPTHFLTAFFSAIAVSLAMTIYYAYNYDSDQGRYMFPVLIPVATVMALGFNALFPRRFRRAALSGVIIVLAGINTLVLWRLVEFYY
jgi:hypothetical protein